MSKIEKQFVDFVRSIYGAGYIPLHRPVFEGSEKTYLNECVDTNFVSSIGQHVGHFEKQFSEFTGSKFAISTVNGTAALHIGLLLAGVMKEDEVITQALTFVATANAVKYVNAHPIFLDVDKTTMGLCPNALVSFLETHCCRSDGKVMNKTTNRRIAACVPMHTFGMPCEIEQIVKICEEWSIPVIEDAAESLGSYVGSKHTGRLGLLSTFSFNGNKIITTGGGGMIITDDAAVAKRAKHLTTTAKVPHQYEFIHDEVGYNYRLPSINAALGCAQLEQLPSFLKKKALIAERYRDFFDQCPTIELKGPRKGASTNNWLNSVVLPTRKERDEWLIYTNDNGVMTRPVWRLLSKLDMFKNCQTDSLENSIWLQDRLVNIPSSVP